ncbi:cytochrome P450 [Pluteus cervinus]|uniref:Cytochrome P450 n=1 Tax=Pluteus cervinus TaxID=181527 RepID=A0ACD3ANQ1_9AGAR|nr:cytochrome P450 [Pluteus cervinus]
MDPPSMFLAVLFTLSIVLAIVIRPNGPKSRPTMPPGPKGLPFLGNVLQIPAFQFLRLTEWKEQFGLIFSLNLAGQQVVVINSVKIAVDLLERRSGLYSDRPRFIMASEILTGNLFLPVMKYGDAWRKLHKAAHEGLKSQVLPVYQPAQALEATLLAQNLVNRPEEWYEEIKRSTASSMKTMVYGTPPIAYDDPVVAYMNGMGHRLTVAMAPGKYLVELFPKMLYLPSWLAPWKREGLAWHERDTQELKDLLRPITEQVDNGTHKPSFAANLHLAANEHNLTQKEEAWLTGTMFFGGSDTSSAVLAFFILAMRLYPQVMKKAQAELDRVIGRDRVPDLSDREELPYIRALVKELLRWCPVGPLGIPRQIQQDDYYDGYLIPKGTLILVNSWGMNNDPEVFPDPREFRPERFLDPTETIHVAVPGTRNQGHVTFGFGRRICSGMNLATQFLFINIATLLWSVNVEPAYDQDGQAIVPSPTDWIDEGTLMRPVPFRCNFVPRFNGVETLLRRAREKSS